jgi:4-hydroxybenzoate polyprenyltransferase
MASPSSVPLCVDLDGTLINSDSLHEGLVVLLKRNPLYALALPVWLAQGKPAFKNKVALRAPLDVDALPFNDEVLALLKSERGRRPIVLCTAAHERYARAISDRLGLFDRVFATEEVNLAASEKVRTLIGEYGERGFDYMGDALQDVGVFRAARSAIAVNPAAGLRRRLSEVENLDRVIDGTRRGGARAWLRALRMHQWIKNLLVFIPLVAAHRAGDPRAVFASAAAFVIYGLTASAVYLLNDLVDLKADRAHPRKRRRGLASGAISIPAALMSIPVLLLVALVLAWKLSPQFAALIALYFLTSNAYAFRLKQVPILDSLVLAGLYTFRVLAGAAAISVTPSFWLLSFSVFFFFSLALSKRHSELLELADPDGEPAGETRRPSPRPSSDLAIPGRGYNRGDLSIIVSEGTAAGIAAVLVLALFINSESARGAYRHPEALWLICPLVLYWITKLWLNSQRGQIEDDPVVWAVENRTSRAIIVLCFVLFVLAI